MSELTTNTKGEFELNSISSQMSFANNLLNQKVISDTFKTPQQVVIAIQFCKALDINPMVGLKMMYVVHGKPALFGDGPLSLIQATGKLEWIEEFWIDGNGEKICFVNKNLKATPYAAICRLKRVNDSNIQEDYFTLDDVTLAQIKSPTWAKYQRTMMRYRARTQALKSKFADVLNGIDIAEYVSNDLPNENVRIDSPEIITITDDQKEMINTLMIETETDSEKFLSFMKKESFDDFTSEDAIRAITALNQKKEALCLQK